ncbi:MAG: ribonuclease HII [Candidatus Electrothrix sp. GW3-4]|uniref:ribonuclease HII n=1 Tax=Candidatus Electrothrix sp. GW3-4 TaxID=3126740 RepID=UPI0030CE5C21
MRKNTPPSSSPFLLPSLPDADTFAFERSLKKQGFLHVAGVDEAGRGPLAGPVVAGCVIFSPKCDTSPYQDSKKITARQRDILFKTLSHSKAAIGIGIADPAEIDRINILQASLLAMQRAVQDCAENSGLSPDFLLVDGTFKVPLELPQQPLTKGESKSASIAAASIIAKVTRDRIMAEYHLQYPQYNFQQHKGYPTKAHRAAIAEFGPSSLHRKTFKGVREFFQEGTSVEEQAEQKYLWKE